MEAFTMVIIACVSGEPICHSARISELDFTTVAACETRIDETVSRMTKQLALKPELKGRAVTYDVSCMDRAQLLAKLGAASSDI
jgi:hypothetical protein